MALDYSQLQALNALMSEGGPDEWTPPDQQHGASFAASSKRMTPASIGPAASTASASAMLAASKQQVRGVSNCGARTSAELCRVASAEERANEPLTGMQWLDCS